MISFKQDALRVMRDKAAARGNFKRAEGIEMFMGKVGKHTEKPVKKAKPIRIRSSKRLKTLSYRNVTLSTL